MKEMAEQEFSDEMDEAKRMELMDHFVASITGIAHVGIRVHDLDRSRAFYELLGFEFVVGPVGPEPVAILTLDRRWSMGAL